MKTAQKSLAIAMILIGSTFFLINCEGKKPKAQESQEQKPTIEAPSNLISLHEANGIYDNYSKHRATLIQAYETKERAPEKQFEPSRFVDFDYDTIKQYLDYVCLLYTSPSPRD